MKSPNIGSSLTESPYSESLVGCLAEQLNESRKFFPRLRSLKEAIAEGDITEGYFLEKEALESDRPVIGKKIKKTAENTIIGEDTQEYPVDNLLYVPPEIQGKLEEIAKDAQGILNLLNEDNTPFRARKTQKIAIHPQLSLFNLPMSENNRSALTKSILANGVLEPLKAAYFVRENRILDTDGNETGFVIVRGEILKDDQPVADDDLPTPYLYDGHNRYEISRKLGKDTQIQIDRLFVSLEEAQQQILEVQSARRNLNKWQLEYQIGEWLSLEAKSGKLKFKHRASQVFGVNLSDDKLTRLRNFAESCQFLAQQISEAIADEWNDPSLAHILQQCHTNPENFHPNQFIGKLLEILPQKPGGSYPKTLAAIAKAEGQRDFILHYLSHTFHCFETSSKFPSLPKYLPGDRVTITETGKYRGQAATVTTYSSCGGLAILELEDGTTAEILMTGLTTFKDFLNAAASCGASSPPQEKSEENSSFPLPQAQTDPLPPETENLPPKNEGTKKHTTQILHPPKNQSLPPQNKPSPLPPISRSDIEKAIALLERAQQEELLSKEDLEKLLDISF